MSHLTDLIERLRNGCVNHPRRWSGDTHDDLGGSVDEPATNAVMAEAADALESLHNSAPLMLLADIRFACGDNGKRMQDELVEYIRELRADSDRLAHLADCAIMHWGTRERGGWRVELFNIVESRRDELTVADLRAAIDEDREAGNG